MPTITHNKLVRDKIPEIISSVGKQAVTRILSDEEYLAELDRKLTEECTEYQADKSIEEMADVFEVPYAIAEARGYRGTGTGQSGKSRQARQVFRKSIPRKGC